MTIGTGGNGVHVTPRTVAAGLRRAVRASGGQVLTGDARASRSEAGRTTRTGLFPVLGTALLYTGISLANTEHDGHGDLRPGPRRRPCRGRPASPGGLAGLWSALGLLSVRTPSVEVPWATLAAVPGACAVLAVISAVTPAGLCPRRGTGEPAGTRE
ncbi:hypothetical protein ABT301_31725 [Streptomyces sp. NPDC000987]|uniref:hypothetical protein n=1 Tax=Streptomyces sp. NPDC000987 TaxID=3154374 RepID=UPI00332E3A14